MFTTVKVPVSGSNWSRGCVELVCDPGRISTTSHRASPSAAGCVTCRTTRDSHHTTWDCGKVLVLS